MNLKELNDWTKDWHLSEGIIHSFELAIKHERSKAVISLADIGDQERRWFDRHGFKVLSDHGKGLAEVEL